MPFSSTVLFAYFSPETYLPATSLIASVIGFVLMFGKNSFRIVAAKLKSIAGKRSATGVTELRGPHVKPAARLRDRSPRV
jgi:hypothetical protein